MFRIAALTFFVCLATLPAHGIDASWTASLDGNRPERIHFRIHRVPNHQMGVTFAVTALAGLDAAVLRTPETTPVRFALRRDAGVIHFEGTFRKGAGAGQMTFEPNPSFPSAIEALGVAFQVKHGRKTDPDEILLALALHDVSVEFVRSMQAEGYRVPLERYLAMRALDITPDYVRAMRALALKTQ